MKKHKWSIAAWVVMLLIVGGLVWANLSHHSEALLDALITYMDGDYDGVPGNASGTTSIQGSVAVGSTPSAVDGRTYPLSVRYGKNLNGDTVITSAITETVTDSNNYAINNWLRIAGYLDLESESVSPVSATTPIYVNSACASGCDGSTPALGYATLSDALSASSAGDTFIVVAGSGPYDERLSPDAAKDNQTWYFNDTIIREDYDVQTLVDAGTHKWVESNNASYENVYAFLKLGSQQMTNGDMEVSTGWTNSGWDTNALVTSPVYAGTYSRHLANVGSGTNIIYQTKALTAGHTYIIDAYVMGNGSSICNFRAFQQGGGDYSFAYAGTPVSGQWTHVKGMFTAAVTTNYFIQAYSTSNNAEVWIDNFYFYEAQDGFADLWRASETAVDTCVVGDDWWAQSHSINGVSPAPIDDGQNHWAWADFDTLGFSTLYVYINDDSDPTGQDIEIRPGISAYGISIGSGDTGHKFYNVGIQGANAAAIYAVEAFTINGGRLENTDSNAIQIANSGTNYIAGVDFVDCGHRAIQIDDGHDPTVFAIGNHADGCHLFFRYYDVDNGGTPTFRIYNNTTTNLMAGAVQLDGTGITYSEDYNQWHIDYNSHHASKSLGFTQATNEWSTTGTHSYPSALATNGACDSADDDDPTSGGPCGYDPTGFTAQGLPLSEITGTPYVGVMFDNDGNYLAPWSVPSMGMSGGNSITVAQTIGN
jgi:hypothetical protein